MSVTDIWVLCAPKNSAFEIQERLRSLGLTPNWLPQPNTPGTVQARIVADLEDSKVVSLSESMIRLGVAFEITQLSYEPALILGHPGLGLKRLALDASGEIVIRVGQLERLLTEAGGNVSELERLIRLEKGTAWLDLLEPYRLASLRVSQLPRAV